MPTTILSTSGLTGTDGIVPVYDPTARWCWWDKAEIYVGGPGAQRYIPKIGDYVKDKEQDIDYVVKDIDPVTLIANLALKVAPANSGIFSDDDMLVGINGGSYADTYRVYLDSGITPHTLTVDGRLKVGGNATSYAKIFRGSDTSSTGKVISRLYDQTGTLLSNNIPLELAAVDTHTNHSIKIVSPAYTNESIEDGEIVTIVFYTDVAQVVSKRQLLVENTAYIRSVNSAQKYITGIGIESPFLSSTTDFLIEFPVNVPIAGLGLMGIIKYSDGSVIKLPVDGNKFKIFGLDSYVATIVGQRIPLVLMYSMVAGETAVGGITNDGKHISRPLNLVTLAQNGAYAVKLFGYPVWQNSVQGYTMKWFMYTLDRSVVYDVTQYVVYNVNFGAFNPTLYGFQQNLSVSLNLRDVSGTFKPYIHVQTIGIVLAHPGDARTTNWTLSINPGQVPPYGIDMHAKAKMITQNIWKLKVDSDILTFDAWLASTYYNTKPLFNTAVEQAPPVPNFFIIKTPTSSTEFPITSWNQVLTVGSGLAINGTVFIRFIRRTSNADIQLGVAGLPVYDDNTLS